MIGQGKDFVSLIPPTVNQPRAGFFGPAGGKNVIRDQFSISTWLALGAFAQGLAFLLIGRLALVPTALLLAYRGLTAYAMTVGFIHDTSMDNIVRHKFSAQIPDETGRFGNKPGDSDIVVFLIGTRVNHPLGILAPGFKEVGDYFVSMMEDLDKRGEEYGYLGSSNYINTAGKTTSNELLIVQYFRTVDGLHKYAHDPLHRKAWDYFNRHAKQFPHIGIYHETYQSPKGHWENIYVNHHRSLLASTTFPVTDPETGEKKWASPIVDASKGVLRSSQGRMSRGKGDENTHLDINE